MSFLARFILRFPALIVAVGLGLAGIGGFYSVKLYQNLRTDLEELLPTTARSVLDLNEVTSRLDSIDNLAVLLFSEDTKASKRFVHDLVAILEKAPKDVIASIEYKISEEIAFFESRSALYIETEDLQKIRDYIDDRIEYEKSLYNPINIFSEQEIPEPFLDFSHIEKKYKSRAGVYSKFPEGYYATADAKKRVVLIYMPGKSSGVSSTHKLKAYVQEAVESLKPETYAKDLKVIYTGGVQNTIEEQASLVSDLGVTSIIVILFVSLAMFLYFRAKRAVICLLISLFVGTAWTFGLAYAVIGYLNANSAFLGSIIIGNGINFGVIILARYLEERRLRKNHARAIVIAMQHTFTATWTASLAAALSYGSLTLTSFRGFNQFGIIGLLGMLLCWLAAFTMLPALLTIFDGFRTLTPVSKATPKAWITERVAALIKSQPKLIWAVSFTLTLLSVVSFLRLSSDVIETDLEKLRDKTSMTEGSGFYSRYVDEIFQRNLTPMIVLPKNREDAREVAKRLKAKKAQEGATSMLASVQTLDDFVPQDQMKKIRLLADIKRLLPDNILKRLAPADKNRVKALLDPQTHHPVTQENLPPLIISKFTEKDGSIGKMVVIEPPIGKETLDGTRMLGMVTDVRKVADSVSPGTAVAGVLPISADLISSITRDGPIAAVLAFLAVVLLVVFLFRNAETIYLVLFALILGFLWMCGFVLAFKVKVNFLNFIAFPITFGIGVDYGVNIFQRYKEEGSGSIIRVIRDTGGAVGLCSLTTIIGYSSLLMAGNQAFVSFGLFCVIGELTCVAAAIFSLPAYLILRDQRKTKKATA